MSFPRHGERPSRKRVVRWVFKNSRKNVERSLDKLFKTKIVRLPHKFTVPAW